MFPLRVDTLDSKRLVENMGVYYRFTMHFNLRASGCPEWKYRRQTNLKNILISASYRTNSSKLKKVDAKSLCFYFYKNESHHILEDPKKSCIFLILSVTFQLFPTFGQKCLRQFVSLFRKKSPKGVKKGDQSRSLKLLCFPETQNPYLST